MTPLAEHRAITQCLTAIRHAIFVGKILICARARNALSVASKAILVAMLSTGLNATTKAKSPCRAAGAFSFSISGPHNRTQKYFCMHVIFLLTELHIYAMILHMRNILRANRTVSIQLNNHYIILPERSL
ncbi:hypothetical protein C4571_01940 [Candidatus Parcubacteria bacterium]|nr:MAG: hypothetical protein C4571_01940 [Candidatus Parcubacteria bacterium]